MNRVANRFEGRNTTFAEFDANVSSVFGALEQSGAARIAYLGKNSDWAFELYIGAGRAGGVFAPINWRLAPREVAQIIETFEPDLLFVGPEFHDAVEENSGELPDYLGFVAMPVAHFKCPKTVDLVAQMPRNATGKLLKRELRKPYWEGRARQVN
ncbi:AMP-binding protein [Flavimaribacter sediminis]|uniref:AMP-binding protein n=1 Tax=Flavimaribacter sediminis TaxID=2865987 RepID=UPI00215DBE61|nr:AMP-binding protein [Flavimaribacter sediminis]